MPPGPEQRFPSKESPPERDPDDLRRSLFEASPHGPPPQDPAARLVTDKRSSDPFRPPPMRPSPPSHHPAPPARRQSPAPSPSNYRPPQGSARRAPIAASRA